VSHRDPERFHIERGELVRELRMILRLASGHTAPTRPEGARRDMRQAFAAGPRSRVTVIFKRRSAA
jgi:hypothetical protein